MQINYIKLSDTTPADSAVLKTPCGVFALYSNQDVLLKTEWLANDVALSPPQGTFLKKFIVHLDAYWQGVALQMPIKFLLQGTAYQRRVWQELSALPFGGVLTYSTFAGLLDSGARAVGGACRRNPWPLIVPCHRIVAVNGYGGYAGATKGRNMQIKRFLLQHEKDASNV